MVFVLISPYRYEGAPMAETQIEWTDATWNPVAGCSIVSAGCSNCYAMEMAKRLQAMGIEKYNGLTRRSGTRIVWNSVVREDRSALAIPLRWKKPKKIFVNSMSDLFHEDVSDSFILEVWKVMAATPRHHYQILTKRPERMAEIVRSKIKNVLPNVWLGTSIENAEVSRRADALRDVPAAIRFISFEPLIGSVGPIDLQEIHWAIVGGESGKFARPIREEWIDSTNSVTDMRLCSSSNNGAHGAKITSAAPRKQTVANIVAKYGMECQL